MFYRRSKRKTKGVQAVEKISVEDLKIKNLNAVRKC